MSLPDQHPRPASDVDEIAEEYVRAALDVSPLAATMFGLPGRTDDIDDLSPDGWAAKAEVREAALARLDGARPADDVDRVTLDAMRERLGVEQECYEAGFDTSSLNVIESPLQQVRDIVDVMPQESAEDWEAVAARLTRTPRALEQWHTSLLAAAERGHASSRRQVAACVIQARAAAERGGAVDALARTAAGTDLPAALRRTLDEALATARAGYAACADRLRDEMLPRARQDDACGREQYEIASRSFLGARVDLEETYAWGQEELARITADMEAIATEITGSSDVRAAAAALDADPRYGLEGTDALREWMQRTADRAVADLAGTHFDIPDPVRTIECRIAPTATGGIYYTGPSDDFSRPGRMWWAVPPGVTRFGTWRELTTVYHEGVPGHHLQIGQAVHRRDALNTWRRQFAWTSGHGEGWALYAERLMAELGYLEEPGDRLGWLDGQSLRAARVVLDIGLHCGFEAPAEAGGGAWTYDKAWSFLCAHANMAPGFLRFELDRYLGWPGQAPSYKIGERLWLRLREEARERAGDGFDLRDFHRRALDIGGMGLDTLRRAVLDEWDAA